MTRSECLDEILKSKVKTLIADVLRSPLRHDSFCVAEAQWFELRESFVRVLFELDRELANERDAKQFFSNRG